MKQRLKQITKFMAIFALVVIAGCEKDLYDEHLHQGKVKSEISLEQFKRETGLNDFIPTIKIKLNDANSLQRTPDGSYELSDFDIDTNIIKRIVIDEKTTYTFQLIPKEVVDDRFFNIIYFYKNGWQTQILEIKPTTENLIQLKAGITTNVDGTISKLYSSDLSLSTQSCVTFNIYTEHCFGCTGSCDGCNLCVTRTSVTICGQAPTVLYIDGNGGVGGGPGSDGSVGVGGGPSDGSLIGNNNSEDEIATAPVLSSTYLAGQEQAKTPCTLLNKLKIDNGFIARMKNLAYASNNYAFESGQMIYDNTTNPTNANKYTYVPFQGQIDAPIASYTGNTSMQGVIHSHYIGASLSIFSVDDLADLYEKMKVAEVTDDFFLGVVCPQGNAYIMQVNDRAAFIAFGDLYLSTAKKKEKFDKDICQKKYNIKMDNSSSDNENGFVKMLKEMNIGTNIAKSTFVPSPNITSNTTVFKDWTKLNYNETTQTVEPQTCN